MGTCNFSTSPDGFIYAIDNDDEFIYNDTIENLKAELNGCPYFYETDAHNIGRLEKDISFLNEEITICYNLFVSSGYYSGLQLDYNAVIIYDNSEYNITDIDALISDLREYSGVNNGLITIHRKKLEMFLNDYITMLYNITITAYKSYSNTLSVAGRFSDGTCIYNEV